MPFERQTEIMKLLKRQRFYKYEDLAKTLFVSAPTIRRDTADMERRGLVKRVLGGVTLTEEPKDVPYDLSVSVNHNAKLRIGERAASLVHEGMCLFLDSSTTVAVMLQAIEKIDNLYIVTNGLVTAMKCAEQTSWEVNVVGGNLNRTLMNVSGGNAVRNVDRYQADLAFFSCRGLTVHGATDANDLESSIKQEFAENASETALLVDSTKFGKHMLYQSAAMNDLDYIISDEPLPDRIAESAQKYGVTALA